MIEYLTAEIAARAKSLMDEIEAHGGMSKAIEVGLPKLRIEEAAASKQGVCYSEFILVIIRSLSRSRYVPGFK